VPFEYDPYVILGVPKNATDKEIKNAYRAMALKHHPDKNPGNEAATAKFQEIIKAYEILYDNQKRADYDRYGPAGI
jgi:molecular chaperone DnaJ